MRSGADATREREIATRVSKYFYKHPDFGCDLIHVAAIASRVRAGKDGAIPDAPVAQIIRSISPRPQRVCLSAT